MLKDAKVLGEEKESLRKEKKSMTNTIKSKDKTVKNENLNFSLSNNKTEKYEL